MVFARTTGATYVSGTVTCLCRARLISSHPTVIDAMPTRKLRFAVDSPVEGDGFERSVPGETGLLSKRERICRGTEGSNPSPSSRESIANLTFGDANSLAVCLRTHAQREGGLALMADPSMQMAHTVTVYAVQRSAATCGLAVSADDK
jgi:hypothetical protein